MEDIEVIKMCELLRDRMLKVAEDVYGVKRPIKMRKGGHRWWNDQVAATIAETWEIIYYATSR